MQGRNVPNKKENSPDGAEALEACFFGQLPFGQGWDLQRVWRQGHRQGRVGGLLLLCEHPPTYTLGRGTDEAHLPGGVEALTRRGAVVRRIERGGSVTFHGPGQLVGYPIVDLRAWDRDVHAYLRRLEDVLIDTLAHWGIEGGRRPGLTGVWCGDTKLGAIGIHLRSWVTMHGFSLNVGPDLTCFAAVRPCGLDAGQVGSMAQHLGTVPALPEVAEVVCRSFSRRFGRPLHGIGAGELGRRVDSLRRLEASDTP